MPLKHIKSRKVCDTIMRKGNQWKGKMMMIRWLPGTPRKQGVVVPEGVYVGTFASAKLHKSAVKRNRMRRRVREAFRLEVKDRKDFSSVQLLVTPRIASLDSPFEMLQSDVRAFFSALPSWPQQKAGAPASSITQ